MKSLTLTERSTTYFDDRTLYTIEKNLKELLDNISANIQHLQGALDATGRALNLHKCSYSVITSDSENMETEIAHLRVKIKLTEHIRRHVLDAEKRFF